MRGIAAGLALMGLYLAPSDANFMGALSKRKKLRLLYRSRRARAVFSQLRVISLERLTFCSLSASRSLARDIIYKRWFDSDAEVSVQTPLCVPTP